MPLIKSIAFLYIVADDVRKQMASTTLIRKKIEPIQPNLFIYRVQKYLFGNVWQFQAKTFLLVYSLKNKTNNQCSNTKTG